MHNNGIKKLLCCSVAGDIDAGPSAPNHQYSEYVKLVLVQTFLATLVTDEGSPIFGM